MYYIILFLLILISPPMYAYDPATELAKIEQEAMVIGSGETKVYAFLDPLCSKSQNYLEVISESKRLQEKQTFYIFLYPLEGFDSNELICHIYSSRQPLKRMQKVMLDKLFPPHRELKTNSRGRTKMAKIASIAAKFDPKRRPYLMIFKAGSNYCKVSEGDAPCLQPKK